MWFSDGPYRSMRNYDMRGRRAINLAYENLSGLLGSTFDFNIRETAYSLELSIKKAIMEEKGKFHYMPAGAQKDRAQRMADQLMGMLWQYASDDPDEWMFNQSFMAGIGMRAAIKWFYFADDQRAPILVKRLVDMMNTQMKGLNGEFPNDIAWLRGVAVPGGTNGPKCGFNCSPYPSKELSGMFLPAWAWIWWMTGIESYRTDGDALFNAVVSHDVSYSAKALNEWTGWWGYTYPLLREGRMPAQFLPWQ